MIFFIPPPPLPYIVNYMKQNVVIRTNFCQSLGPLLYRGSTLDKVANVICSYICRPHWAATFFSHEISCGSFLDARCLDVC